MVIATSTLWGRNLRSAEEGLGDWRWRKLRAALIEANGKACAICGSEKQPHGHEVWEYAPKRRTGVAKLIRVEIICRDCHTIHHWGLQVKLVAQGLMDGSRLDELMHHFCRINACKPRNFRRHMGEAMVVYLERSKLEWDVDWGPYAEAVELACASREALAKDREDREKSHEMRIFDGDGPPPKPRKRKKRK